MNRIDHANHEYFHFANSSARAICVGKVGSIVGIIFKMPALVDAIEFGPADVLDKMISKGLTFTESVQVLDIGSGGAAYWSRLLKKIWCRT